MKFKAYVIDGVSVTPRARLNQEINKFVCTVFNLRTVTTPQMLGERRWKACTATASTTP